MDGWMNGWMDGCTHICVDGMEGLAVGTCSSSLSCSRSACLPSPIASLAAISSSTVPVKRVEREEGREGGYFKGRCQGE